MNLAPKYNVKKYIFYFTFKIFIYLESTSYDDSIDVYITWDCGGLFSYIST